MPAVSTNSDSVRQTELIFRRVESLAVLPASAVSFFQEMGRSGSDVDGLAQIVESDPSLMVRVYMLAAEHNIGLRSVKEILEKLPRYKVRDAILSLDVHDDSQSTIMIDAKKVFAGKELVRHSIAVGCCASEIASASRQQFDPLTAFLAGSLINIGKTAILTQMPKSYERIILESRSEHLSLVEVEQKYLGMDHMVISKRLAQKWNMPSDVVMALWLYRNEGLAFCEQIELSSYAIAVRLADMIVADEKITLATQTRRPEDINVLAQSLGIDKQGLVNIRDKFLAEYKRRSKLIGLDSNIGMPQYCECLRKMSQVLAKSNSVLQEKNLQLAGMTADNTMLKGLIARLPDIKSSADIQAGYAQLFQSTFRCGPVCYMSLDGQAGGLLDGLLVREGSSKAVLFRADCDLDLLRTTIAQRAQVSPVDGSWNWFFEQTEGEFDRNRSWCVPIIIDNRATGVLFFSLGKFDMRLSGDQFRESINLFAGLLTIFDRSDETSKVLEKFIYGLNHIRKVHDNIAETRSFGGIAEMAAGAAHELNNPLSVISGRAQLLLQIETDDSKKQMLKQVQDRTDEISRIVTDLMSFAKPHGPNIRPIDVKVLLDSAINQAIQESSVKEIEVTFDSIDNLPKINVDSQQIVNAISNIIVNSLDSYTDDVGPIFISGMINHSLGWLELIIADNGCGMENETLQNATRPFYSAKKAGRKRGMGLSHSKRLIELNSGTLSIHSHLGEGTKVSVRLPLYDGPVQGSI